MDVVEMVLGGRVNKGLVTLIQQAGGQAVGLCGKDSSILNARQMVEAEIGFVGAHPAETSRPGAVTHPSGLTHGVAHVGATGTVFLLLLCMLCFGV